MTLKAIYDKNQQYFDFKDEQGRLVAHAWPDLDNDVAQVTIYPNKLNPDTSPADVEQYVAEQLEHQFGRPFGLQTTVSQGSVRLGQAAAARQSASNGFSQAVDQARTATQPLFTRIQQNDQPPWLRRGAIIAGLFILLLLLFLIVRGLTGGDTGSTANTGLQGTAQARLGTQPARTGAATTGQAAGTQAALGSLGAGTPLATPLLIVPTLASTPAPAAGQHQITVIDPDPNGLNFRENPGPENKLLGTLKFGTKLTDLGDRKQLQLNWRHVRTPDGRVGWIAESDPSGPLVSDLTVGQQTKVQTGQSPNLRTEPSIQSKSKRQLNSGEKLTLTGLDKGSGVPGVWWQVKAENGDEGWVAENDGSNTLIVPQ